MGQAKAVKFATMTSDHVLEAIHDIYEKKVISDVMDMEADQSKDAMPEFLKVRKQQAGKPPPLPPPTKPRERHERAFLRCL